MSDKMLDSPLLTVTGQPATLSFQRLHNLEAGFDGMVLEISLNGAPFTDAILAGGSFTAGGYNVTISTGFSSPIGGRNAWSGNTGTFVLTTYALPSNATSGSSVRFR